VPTRSPVVFPTRVAPVPVSDKLEHAQETHKSEGHAAPFSGRCVHACGSPSRLWSTHLYLLKTNRSKSWYEYTFGVRMAFIMAACGCLRPLLLCAHRMYTDCLLVLVFEKLSNARAIHTSEHNVFLIIICLADMLIHTRRCLL